MVVHKCNQIETIKEMQKGITESEKRDILQAEQILTMNQKIDNVDKKLDEWLKMLSDKIDSLENKFVLRVEFRVAMTVLIAISTILWILWYFMWK